MALLLMSGCFQLFQKKSTTENAPRAKTGLPLNLHQHKQTMYFTLACGATIVWGFATKGASGFVRYGSSLPLLYCGYWFVSGVLLHFPSLIWPKKKLPERLGKVKLIAHRGGRVETPENTLAAFDNAVKRGAHQVEFDVWESKDKVPVVFHDATFARMCGGDARVVTDTLFEDFPKIQLPHKSDDRRWK